MSDAKDPAIKLFGKTIPLLESPPSISGSDGPGKDLFCDEAPPCKMETDSNHNETTDPNETTLTDDNPKTPTTENESRPSDPPKPEDEQTEEKTLRKPDKILPCPRCNSMDTKFCYYNNYNVTQPRHFCKNCQRYWTAGGTMRNVPVGAGRRKNKSSSAAAHYRHVIAQADVANGAHCPVRPNGTVLAFGGGERVERGERSDGHCSVSSENGNGNGNENENVNNKYIHQVPMIAGPTWPYQAQWVLPPPGVIPMPFYPGPPYWGAVGPTWALPWGTMPLSTSPISPNLGKHSREENRESEEGENRRESSEGRSLWVPKTLRIDDPGEAAKSSIWATLGINYGNFDMDSRGGGGKGSLFKAFKSRVGDERENSENSPVLLANPAALSRSRNFHESL